MNTLWRLGRGIREETETRADGSRAPPPIEAAPLRSMADFATDATFMCAECPRISIPALPHLVPVLHRRCASLSTKCSQCARELCETHARRARGYGKRYRGKEGVLMCDKCCWDEIG